MFINQQVSLTKRKTRRRGANRNFHSGRGSNGHRSKGRGWMSMGVQTGGQNPFFRMHGKFGFKSQLRKRKNIKLIDLSQLGTLPEGVKIDRDFLLFRGLMTEREVKRNMPFKLLNSKKIFKSAI